MADNDLLREYARTGSEDAFARIVQQHVGLVYSAALRQVRDAQIAQDVTQTVFIVLARKARQLAGHPGLSGWLLKATRYAANAHIRAAVRRTQREQEAVLQSLTDDSSPAAWAQLEPYLDEALASLSDTDRAVVALRYFEKKSAAEIGQVLHLPEETAKKRTLRSLEKLRKFFHRRGIALSATVIASAITANAIQAAPIGLATLITSTALSTKITTAAIIATTKTIAMTTIQKACITAALIATASVGLVEARKINALHAQNQQLQQQQTPLTQQIDQLQRELADATNRLANLASALASAKQDNLELLRLRGQVGTLRNQSDQLSRQNDQLLAQQHALQGQSRSAVEQEMFEGHQAEIVNALKLIGLAMLIYSNDHDNTYPTNFEQMTLELETNKFGTVSLNDLELVNVGIASPNQPQIISGRERTYRKSPDGKFYCCYLLADGSVQTIRGDTTATFTDYEDKNGPQPKQ